MPLKHIRIATRESKLALKQAELVSEALKKQHPRLNTEVVPITTTGDQQLNHSLSAIGGKGLFIKELEQALFDNRADIAVHSMKDMPAQLTDGLEIAAFMEREDPRDVLVSRYQLLMDLPKAAKVGTASLRRQSMVKHIRPDLRVETLRGNVITRLKKLEDGLYDAIILAAAGLHRLGLEKHIQYYFSPEESLPAIGQGIIGIQCRAKDTAVKKLLAPLDHYPTRVCVLAERSINTTLGGNCHSPISGYATIVGDKIVLRGQVSAPDGSIVFKSQAEGSRQEAERLGKSVADDLLSQGAGKLL